MISLKEAAAQAGFDTSTTLDWAEVVTTLSKPDAKGGPYHVLSVEPGEYRCKTTMRLSAPTGRPIRIVGTGPVNQHAASGRGASFVWPSAPPDGGPLVEILAPDCEVERVAFRGRGTAMPLLSNGVVARARVHMRHVWITSLNVAAGGSALVIDGSDTIWDSAGKGLGPGANSWDLYDVAVRGVWGPGNGIHVRGGGDSNAGCATLVNASDVQEGIGIWDDGFLGNLWQACHVHQGATNNSPPYKCVDPNARSLFIRCYTEGLKASDIRRPSMWIQGQGRVEGGCTSLSEGRMRNVTIFDPTIQGVRDARTGVVELMRWNLDGNGDEIVDDWWSMIYDPRPGAHNRWLRLLSRGASSAEVLAMREGGLRSDGISPIDTRMAAAEKRIAELEAKLAEMPQTGTSGEG